MVAPSMADALLEPGRILAGKYRLGERLGEGGMGAVYRAEHLVLQAPVAIKVIERELEEGTRARFIREAQAAAALRSPHVVQILDYGAEDDFPFMVMELLEGETLAQRIKRRHGRLSPQETAWILTHVGRAVAKAHELGIVHRDLKPDNVFLVHNEEDEIAKVLDFGVAKIEATSLSGDSHTQTGSLLGTPYYMSPEQAQGNKAIDYRSDLWALGVIAFECLTGRRPFASDGLGDLVLQICIRDIPLPSSVAPVPIGFDPWFAKAMQREPDDRFQSAKELTDALREALGEKDSPSTPNILVMSAASGTPAPAEARSDDARPTALEVRAVDQAAETMVEGARSQASARALPHSEGSSPTFLEEETGLATAADVQSSLGPSVERAGFPAPLPSPWEPGVGRRRNAGVFFAVGAGALAVGVLATMIALRDRPGFRVGDIEGPSPEGQRSSLSVKPSGASSKEGSRQPAQPRAQRGGKEDDASGSGSRPRVIDGRSILEPMPAEALDLASQDTPQAGRGTDKLPAPNTMTPTEEQPGDAKVGAGDSTTSRAGAAQPGAAQPGAAQPGAAQPGPTPPKEPSPPDANAPPSRAGQSKSEDSSPEGQEPGAPTRSESGDGGTRPSREPGSSGQKPVEPTDQAKPPPAEAPEGKTGDLPGVEMKFQEAQATASEGTD
jgi:eukaryotic-like serine/threonine-protein kinase